MHKIRFPPAPLSCSLPFPRAVAITRSRRRGLPFRAMLRVNVRFASPVRGRWTARDTHNNLSQGLQASLTGARVSHVSKHVPGRIHGPVASDERVALGAAEHLLVDAMVNAPRPRAGGLEAPPGDPMVARHVRVGGHEPSPLDRSPRHLLVSRRGCVRPLAAAATLDHLRVREGVCEGRICREELFDEHVQDVEGQPAVEDRVHGSVLGRAAERRGRGSRRSASERWASGRPKPMQQPSQSFGHSAQRPPSDLGEQKIMACRAQQHPSEGRWRRTSLQRTAEARDYAIVEEPQPLVIALEPRPAGVARARGLPLRPVAARRTENSAHARRGAVQGRPQIRSDGPCRWTGEEGREVGCDDCEARKSRVRKVGRGHREGNRDERSDDRVPNCAASDELRHLDEQVYREGRGCANCYGLPGVPVEDHQCGERASTGDNGKAQQPQCLWHPTRHKSI
ncbi:hypothetical protein Ctob_002453, partial [Chrysochromulina tobinii]